MCRNGVEGLDQSGEFHSPVLHIPGLEQPVYFVMKEGNRNCFWCMCSCIKVRCEPTISSVVNLRGTNGGIRF